MMKKRFLSILLVCAMVLLTACGGHTHSAGESWVSDLENHWHACECGEQVDSAAHTLEDNACTVCGTEIVTYEDGMIQLTAYNEYGDCTQAILYAADGSVEYDEQLEYTYDADGNRLSQKNYTDGVLNSEYEYALNSAGESYVAKDTYYYEDGTWTTSTYDENWNTLTYHTYAEDGTVAYGEEYAYDGDRMFQKTYEGDRLTSEYEYLLDQEGWQICVRYVFYNEDGSYSVTEYDEYENETLEASYAADGTPESEIRYESEYDADGNRTLRRTYEDGRLTEEMEFLFGSDDEGSWSMSGKTTAYYEDGSKRVSDSDPDGAWSSEITYDADGNVQQEYYYEYLEDENGESVGSKGYLNGRLFQEVQSIMGEDGTATGMLWIYYDEDGSKTVTEYDDAFELLKETVYDAAGNVISESE